MLKKLFDISSNEPANMPASNVISLAQTRTATAPPIVAVIGAKGGVGTTSIAINLAAALSLAGVGTTIIDANLQQPDVANMVGKEPKHSFMELLNRQCGLDRQIFEACLAPVGNSDLPLNLLSPPLDGSAAFKTNLSQLAECLNSLRSYSQFWMLDLPRHIDKHLVTITDMADKIVLVFEATIPGVATCRRWLNIFTELGYSKHKIICVLNRAGSKYMGVEKQLSQYFTDEAIFSIPNASLVAWECSTRGTPIVLAQPNHKYSQAMIKLAHYLNQSCTEVINV